MIVEERGLDAHDHRRSTLNRNERMCARGEEHRVIYEWNARRRLSPRVTSPLGFEDWKPGHVY
jgi:hypothetical protein